MPRMSQREPGGYRPGETLRARKTRLEESARRDAGRIARLLIREFGAKRVWLFGSLATGRGFRRNSDIDLAVEGLRPDQFFRAVGRALQLARFPVDLKPFEELPADAQRRILREGKALP